MFNLKGNVCILGDSIVYGAWDEEKHGYVNRLREDLKENNQVENVYGLGIPGETTAGLLKRLDTELQPRTPNTIIVGIGINDTIYIKNKQQESINIKEFISNISKIIAIATTYTNNILMLGLTKVIEERTTPILWNDNEMYFNDTIKKYDIALEDYCNMNKVQYLKLFDLLQQTDFSDDGIHPNEKGHEKIYKAIKLKGEKYDL
jgi:lysophospholipase L1-like esterase